MRVAAERSFTRVTPHEPHACVVKCCAPLVVKRAGYTASSCTLVVKPSAYTARVAHRAAEGTPASSRSCRARAGWRRSRGTARGSSSTPTRGTSTHLPPRAPPHRVRIRMRACCRGGRGRESQRTARARTRARPLPLLVSSPRLCTKRRASSIRWARVYGTASRGSKERLPRV
jgi:hypothetical protein